MMVVFVGQEPHHKSLYISHTTHSLILQFTKTLYIYGEKTKMVDLVQVDYSFSRSQILFYFSELDFHLLN
ncbi:hypothetical protein CICLE_v10010116mg [Citrus x clementina]|uniref:Uncharacterized protein n=2 Tax=Citrus TaxID=2706 RepID=A0A067GK39_CITSI|nr:hypothetical protein CICLE_v10010116mg [Citrus x clementina]KDO80093.1 hypothetical protein CISIN_1g040776mg [Citrus sinensis]